MCICLQGQLLVAYPSFTCRRTKPFFHSWSVLRRYWMSVGAQPSQTVGRLLGQAGVIPKPPPPMSLKTQLRGVKNPDKGKKR